ncbi:type II restriction endonuclease [Shewanella aegiceratis]|uniref:type II restriction endonuclease n=1 Tax=Shewanella aegiceratis TaxID=2864203 RepID=UPI001C6624EC|nr:type II restriction endonuclease [Shewanella aegiceratis]QYJ82125.1 type II restriction endonuclease [Shewanella aegiceratis]
MKFIDWLYKKYLKDDCYLYIKRLSANDTGASGGHQVGVYFPNIVLSHLFPSINSTTEENPSVELASTVVNPLPESCAKVRAIYYNNQFFGKTRNEKRITRWGGKKSPLQNREFTGSAVIFAFDQTAGKDAHYLEVWICTSLQEEAELEACVGELVSGDAFYGPASEILVGVGSKYKKGNIYEIPPSWKVNFPSGDDIVRYVSENFKIEGNDPDKMLIERRDTEYALFKKVEEHHVFSLVREGFKSMDDFMATANSVSNRRKSRSGRSLELHLENIFKDNGLLGFSTQSNTEGNKKPDFIFPSIKAYKDEGFPAKKLRMLAVKTTCKDRWRQILNEANRVKTKHLFTLQQGVSENQFNEMKEAGVKLVVPKQLHGSFPKSIRDELITLTDFIEELKSISNE